MALAEEDPRNLMALAGSPQTAQATADPVRLFASPLLA
jgi:hypothetical protein